MKEVWERARMQNLEKLCGIFGISSSLICEFADERCGTNESRV